MDLVAYKDGVQIDKARVMSVGGGSIAFEGEDYVQPPRIYKHDKFSDISDYCKNNEIKLYDYVMENEDEHILDYVRSIWQAMKKSIKCGLADSGVLPGGLEVEKKARFLYNNEHVDETAETKENRVVCAYAFAVGEQNASGEKIVTAPTCGAAGVLPAVLYYQQQKTTIPTKR